MRERRGLSTVVGAVFFVIAAATSITYITYSMNTVDEFAQTIAINEVEQTNKVNEKFEISQVRIDNGKFNFTIQNTGNVPVTIDKLWIDNKTDSAWIPKKFTVDKNISPGGVKANIGQDISLVALDTEAYDIKLVTSRGNLLDVSLNSDVSANLYTNLIAIPDIVSPGFSTTVILEVVNNMTSNDILTEISPTITCGSKLTPITSLTPTSVSTLVKGDTATFRKVYKASGTDGDSVTCTAVLRTGGSSVGSEIVTLQDPAFASQSATALESEGLTCCKTGDDTMAFHAETSGATALSNSYQLYSGLPELNGYIQSLDTVTPIRFFTLNDTTNTVDVPSGNWDLTFVYNSDLIPSGIAAPDMVYFFDSTYDVEDSSGHILTMTPSSTAPTIVEAGDPHGHDSAQFDGSSTYYAIPYSAAYNNIGNAAQTTAGWFKIDSSQTGRGTIYRVESTTEWYEVSFDTSTNALQYRFFTNGNNAVEVICQKTGLSLNTWHFFVAVRDAAATCKLYVDGGAASTQTQGNTGTGTGKDSVDIGTSNTYLGVNPGTPNTNYLKGELGYIMHWESAPITTESLADKLYDANYGDGTHKLRIEYAITDKDGTELSGSENYIHEESDVLIPFGDPHNPTTGWHEYFYSNSLTNSSDAAFEYHFGGGDRLKIEFEWNNDSSSNSQLLRLNLDTDDNAYGDNIGTKLIIPTPSSAFTSYYVWDVNQDLTFTVSNAGPNGMWTLFSGTRVIFADLYGTGSYGALLHYVNGSSTDANTDGAFLDVGEKNVLEFYPPKNKPDASVGGGDIIADNFYRMYVSIVGYDEEGSNVFRTFYVGVVNVCDTSCP